MNEREEKLVERRVTYMWEHEEKFYIVENVPARVNEETGEQFCSRESRKIAKDDPWAGQSEPNPSNACVRVRRLAGTRAG